MNVPGFGRLPEILLVEDNEADAFLAREAFRQANLAVNLHHVGDGRECLDFLRKQGRHQNVPAPDLVLLDVNMPGLSGHEVLAAVVADAELRHIPVLAMTTSTHEADIARMYSLRCNAYIVKPTDFEHLLKVFQDIHHFWFKLAVLPSTGIRTARFNSG